MVESDEDNSNTLSEPSPIESQLNTYPCCSSCIVDTQNNNTTTMSSSTDYDDKNTSIHKNNSLPTTIYTTTQESHEHALFSKYSPNTLLLPTTSTVSGYSTSCQEEEEEGRRIQTLDKEYSNSVKLDEFCFGQNSNQQQTSQHATSTSSMLQEQQYHDIAEPNSMNSTTQQQTTPMLHINQQQQQQLSPSCLSPTSSSTHSWASGTNNHNLHHHFPTATTRHSSISSNSNSSHTQPFSNSNNFHSSSRMSRSDCCSATAPPATGSGHHELMSNIDQVIVGNIQKRKDSFILFYEQDQSLSDHSILEPIVIRTSTSNNFNGSNQSTGSSTGSLGGGGGDSQFKKTPSSYGLTTSTSNAQLVDTSDVSSTCESTESIIVPLSQHQQQQYIDDSDQKPSSSYWTRFLGGFQNFFMSSILHNHKVTDYLEGINTSTTSTSHKKTHSPLGRRFSLSDDEALIVKFKSRHEQLAKANPKLMIAIAILLVYISFIFINPTTHGYFVFWLGFFVEMSFNITIDTLCSTATTKSIYRLELTNICRTLIAIIGRIVVQTYYGPNFPFWILQTFPIIVSVNIFYYRRIFCLLNTAVSTFGCCLSIYIAYVWEYDYRGKMDDYLYEEMKTKVLEIIGLHFILTVGTYMFSRIMEEQSDDNARKQLELLKQQIVNTAKTKFIGNLSHEARNPLQGILCSIQLLKHETLNSEKTQIFNSQSFRETLDDIYYNSNLLLHIFSTSLQLTNLELGKIKLNEMKINLVDILESMTSVFIRNAEEKRISIGSFYNFKSLPKYIFLGDQSRVCQILMNIISNAIKYTDKGHVLLTAEQCPDKELTLVGIKKDPKYTYVKFVCKDTGCGISEYKTRDLFKKPFYKVDQETFNATIQNSSNPIFEQYYKKSLTSSDIAIEERENEYKENNGYGISISKSLLDLMGGKIYIESKVDEYTKVTIIVPLKNLEGDYSGFDEYSSEFFESNQKTIEVLSKELHESIHHCTPEFHLMDSDNMLTGAIIKRYLQFLFPSSIVFESNLEFYNKNIDRTKYNIVLYNTNSYGAEDFGNSCLAIPISARGQFNDKRYISSPVRFRELVDVLLYYIKLFPFESNCMPPSYSTLVLTPTNEQVPEKVIEPPQKKALVVEDNDINRKVIIKMLKLIGYEHIDSCENGLDSVEKCKQSKYEVILMDLLMPIMNGKDASMQIRKGQNSNTPIIGITANIWETYETLKEFGFDSVLYKPIMLNKLKNEIEKVLLQHSLTQP